MNLTKEQRAALKRVVAYMNRMYGIASPYYGCIEDADLLRAMIDSSDQFGEPNKLIGFDLEVRWHDDYVNYPRLKSWACN